MMKAPKTGFNPHLTAVAVIATIVGTTIATRSGSARPGPQAAAGVSTSPIEEDLRGFVKRAIRENGAAPSYSAWISSGFSPQDIFSHARARAKSDSDAWPALCRALSSLEDGHLALFAREIQQLDTRNDSRCVAGLSARLQSYWQAERASLEAHAAHALASQDGSGSPAKKIALVFDGGPHPRTTPMILAALKAHGARATFFSAGDSARNWPHLIRQELAQGHAVGSSTKSSPDLTLMSLRGAGNNILDGHKLVTQAAGIEVPLFHFPYGAKNETLVAWVRAKGLTPIDWTLDSEDWRHPSPSRLLQHLLSQLEQHPDSTIRMSDTLEQTAIALPNLLNALELRGYTIHLAQ